MKVVLSFLFLLLSLRSNAQYTAENIFKGAPFVFYGIDFTKAKVEHPYYNQEELNSHYFPEWNYLFLRDRSVDIKNCFHNTVVNINVDATQKLNESANFDSKTGASLEKSFIQEAIEKMTLTETKGIGIVLFAGEVKGKGEKFYGKLAFFDINTKKLLMLKKIYGEGEGFGFRNTTASSIKHALVYTKKRWNDWETRILDN